MKLLQASVWRAGFALLALSLTGCGPQSGFGEGSTVNVSQAIEQTRDADPNVRMNAVADLASAGSRAADAVPRLTELLKDEDPIIRRLASYALGEIGPKAEPAVPALRALLSDSDPEVITTTAATLQKLDPKSVEDMNIVNVQSGLPPQ